MCGGQCSVRILPEAAQLCHVPAGPFPCLRLSADGPFEELHKKQLDNQLRVCHAYAERQITLIEDGILFVVCLLVVLRVLPYGVAFAAVLICIFLADHPTLGRVDYSLILTFVALFIFIGNLGRIDAFSGWLQNILTGREVLVSVLASQVTSNVPAAILLSGFTDNYRSLIIGTNLGGLGTLIASMASLISYRQIANEVPAEKGHYFVMFTISNVVFLAILMGAWALS